MQPFTKLALTLLLAYLIGDFWPQSSAMVRGKSQGLRAYFVHGCVHFLLVVSGIVIFAGLQWLTSIWFWVVVLLYVAVHLMIDCVKQSFVSRGPWKDSTTVLVADQLARISAVVVTAWLLTRPSWSVLGSEFRWSAATGERVLEACTVYVAVMFAGGYLIRYLTRNLGTGMEMAGGTAEEEVKNAGMYIGWLERFLVLTAIVVQSPSLVGLILTGKSIARFPELKDDRFAEYFLIGTLLSIGLAVVGGLILAKLWYGTISLK
jgi:hypothetical protein